MTILLFPPAPSLGSAGFFGRIAQKMSPAAIVIRARDLMASALSSPTLSSAMVWARASGRLESADPVNVPAREGIRRKIRQKPALNPNAHITPFEAFLGSMSDFSTLSRA